MSALGKIHLLVGTAQAIITQKVQHDARQFLPGPNSIPQGTHRQRFGSQLPEELWEKLGEKAGKTKTIQKPGLQLKKGPNQSKPWSSCTGWLLEEH